MKSEQVEYQGKNIATLCPYFVDLRDILGLISPSFISKVTKLFKCNEGNL